jgi:uncharacterized protein
MNGLRKAIYTLTVDGQDVTSAFDPHLISLKINLTDGGKSDTLDVILDDTDGRIKLPRADADIEASLCWEDDGAAVTFKGKTDDPGSEGSRGGGRILHVRAHAADMKGKPKAKKSKHKDDATFGDAAKEWGRDAGLEVKVDDALAKIKRPYWAMANESFMAWGERHAREIGATFQIRGKQAVFVPRNGGASASGRPLPSVRAVWGENLIAWSLSPIKNRARFKSAVVRWYDAKTAKWQRQKQTIDDGAEVDLVDASKAHDKDHADRKAAANGEESKRGKGGGSVTIDGDPAAQAQAACSVEGVRPGIDGDYRIASAEHSYTRGGGWTVELDLEQPDGKAGQDARQAG